MDLHSLSESVSELLEYGRKCQHGKDCAKKHAERKSNAYDKYLSPTRMILVDT